MSELWDDPNRQAVGLDPAWVEGTGGTEPAATEYNEPTLDEMTKAQLLTYADDHGVQADDSMTKAEIRAEIDAAA